MKLNNFLTLLLIFLILVGCSSTPKNEEVKINNHRLISNNIVYCPSFEEQDLLVSEFANLFDNTSLDNTSLLEYIFQEGVAPYSLFTFKDNYDSESFEGMLDIDSLTQYQFPYLSELIHNYCTNNLLRFNIVVPNPQVLSNEVYIVNALYRQALGEEASNGLYNVAYINSTPVDHVVIDESFCQSHRVIVLTFRDCITNWQHFAKGEQSISDWLIKSSVSYQGYGCESHDDLVSESGSVSDDVLRIPILHSKKTFQQPCDERYDHFCKLGKPKTDFTYANNPNSFEEQLYMLGADPYITSWSEIIFGEYDQYVYVRDNNLDLDLYGHDFFISDTTFVLDDGLLLHIPAQVCEYDVEMNAQHYVVEWY